MADPLIADIPLRRCSRCRLWKPATREFFCKGSRGQPFFSWCKSCCNAYNKARNAANPPTGERLERKRESARCWAAKSLAANPEHIRAIGLKSYYQHANKRNAGSKAWRTALRAEMNAAYGDKCSCCCESETKFLTLEHINGDGKAHRQRAGGQLAAMVELRNLGWPKEGYTILCWNCQASSWHYGACPHTGIAAEKPPALTVHAGQERRRRLRVRTEMIDAYGSRCDCCGVSEPNFLTIHHVNGDGAEHRKRIGKGAVPDDLRRRGWPKDGFVLLCWNCNEAIRFHGECPHKART